MSVYSSTDQINLLKNIFTPEFQFGAGGYFQPTVKTYLPGNVEIGDPTTDYHLFLNGNALATDTTIAAWSRNPAISTLSMGSNSITNVSSVTFVGGNSFVGTTGTIQNLSGVQTINGFNLCLGSAPTIGTDIIRLGSDSDPITRASVANVSDQVYIGSNAGSSNTVSGLVAIGSGAGLGPRTGGNSVCIGRRAGATTKLNAGAVQLGYFAGFDQSGSNVIMIGSSAGSNSTGSDVVALGYQAAMNNTSADIVAIGTKAAYSNSGQFVVGAGYQAAYNNSGSAVVAIGYNAGASNSGTNCIFLGSNALGSIANTAANTFYVYSTVNNTPFLQGDMSLNTLGIGRVPVAGFGLSVKGAVQNTLSISATSGNITLTSNNASTRFFVSNAVTLTLPTTTTAAGTHWVVTNTSTSPVIATIPTGRTVNNVNSITLPAVTLGVGRQITIAYPGAGTNFYAF